MFQTINNFIIVENIFGFYRNYRFLNTACKTFLILRIMTEISIMILIFFHYKYDTPDSFHFVLTQSYTIQFMLLALYHSKEFKNLHKHLTALDDFSQRSVKTDNFRRKVIVLCLFYEIFIYVPVNLSLIIENFNKRLEPWSEVTGTSHNTILYVFTEVIIIVCDFRFFLEIGVIWSVYVTIADKLRNIIEAISKHVTRRRFSKEGSLNSSISLYPTTNNFDKWLAAYETVEQVTRLCNEIFYWQTTTMITSVVLGFIIVLYNDIVIHVGETRTGHTLYAIMSKVVLLEFALAFYFFSKAAQQVLNNGDELRRLLTQLLAESCCCEPVFKSTKALLRLVNTRPIKFNAFGSVVEMALLPTCVGLVTTNLVTVLQFTNIV